MLKPQYRDKGSCQWAANGTIAGISADAIDNLSGTRSLTLAIDFATSFAIMRCAGMTTKQMLLYHVSLFVLGIVIFAVVCGAAPRMVKKCRVCTSYEQGFKSPRKVCREYRLGNPSECRRAGKVGGCILGFVVAALSVSVVYAVVLFYLKTQIFKGGALIGATVARSFL